MSDLLPRLVTGIALIVIAVGLVWLGGYPFALFVAAVATGVYWEWMQLVKARGIAWKIAGFFYCLIPAIALLWIRDRTADGFSMVMWVFIVTWATDVGGYVVGRAFGKNKLAPSISPAKTWEGLLGGMAFAAVLGGLWAWRFGLPHGLYMLAPLAAIAAQMGDLFESAMKRAAGVKDSGRLLPGHGGLFDRVDGLLVVATLTAFAVYTGVIA